MPPMINHKGKTEEDYKDYCKTGFVDYQEFSDVIIKRLKEYSLATFERAFNDDRDGLRPLARRALYSMYEIHLDKDFKKVQYVSGVEMKYHPYNSDTIADGITQLGQWFVKSYPYLDTQGNFGSLKSIKGYAAPRYIECKLNKFTRDCITDDIDEHSIPYVWNYDNTFMEPAYLPTKLPLTLIQGSVGIGEGFINNIPPYNLGDVVDCCIKVIKNKNIPLKVLMKGIYPDFPTGGEIINKSEIDEFQCMEAAEVERLNREGKNFNLKYRAKLNIDREKNIIEIVDMPYRIDFDAIWEKIIYEVNEKHNVILSGIINKTDNPDPKRKNFHIFKLICKKDANMLEIVDQLYAKTQLSTSNPISFTLYCGKYLERMSFKDIILRWYNVQNDVIRRKFNFQLSDAQNRIHVLEGLVLVYDKMDAVISTIRSSADKDSCIAALVKKFGLSMVQAKGISEMQLSSLTRTSKPALLSSIKLLKEKIDELETKLENIDDVIIANLQMMKEKYNRPRRTDVFDIQEENSAKTSINISNGTILYSRDAVGIFDSSSILNSKTILSSLKGVKVNGKNTKEIIGYHPVKKNVIGTIIFSEDGTARRTKMTEIPITNNWITTNPDNNFITAVVPVYEGEDNYIITMNKDYKIKIFNAEEINAKKVQTGKIIAAAIIGKTDKNVLIYNEYGEYIYIDKSEIPELSRSSSGNSTSFDKGNKIKIIPISKDIEIENLIVGFVENKDDGICTYTAFSEEFLHLGHRTNKPKEFFKLKHSNFVGAGVVNAKTKNNSTVSFISPYNINTVNGKNIKEKMDFKKISVSPFGLIQIPNMEK